MIDKTFRDVRAVGKRSTRMLAAQERKREKEDIRKRYAK